MTIAKPKSVYVIDKAVQDIPFLMGLIGLDQQFVPIDPSQDGFDQLALALQYESGIDALHIISHGSSGNVLLGSASLHAANLADYSAQLQAIANALAPDGDLLIYGSNVAQGEAGQGFVEQLSQMTGVDVAASDDFTASAESGGNSELEIQTGTIDAAPLNLNGTEVTLGLLDTASNFSYVNAMTAAQFAKLAYLHSDNPGTYVSDLANFFNQSGWNAITKPSWSSDSKFDGSGGYKNEEAYALAANRIRADGKIDFILSFEGKNFSSIDDGMASLIELATTT